MRWVYFGGFDPLWVRAASGTVGLNFAPSADYRRVIRVKIMTNLLTLPRGSGYFQYAPQYYAVYRVPQMGEASALRLDQH